MALGDSFGGLLSLSDQAPPPEVAPLNREEGELGRAQKLMAKQRGNTVIGGPFATQTVRDAELADYYEQEDARLAGRRRNEAAGIHAADAAQATAERLKAQFGTEDPHTAALVKATGAFDSDLAQRMKLDPEGTKASVDRAAALLGKGGASDAPTGEGGPPQRQFSVGKGAHGEQYFTNLSREELKAEHHTADAIRGETSPPSVTDLKRIQPGEAGGGSSESQSPADILFQGRLDKAQMIAGTPARQEKHAQEFTKYEEELLQLGRDEDVTTAREKLFNDLQGGVFGKRGITPKEGTILDKELVRRAKTSSQMAEGGVDRTYYMPWHKSAKKPGQAADKAEPATILNPGGAQPVADNVQQQNLMATSERSAHIEDTLPHEPSTTADYALGSPTAQRLKKVAAGEREAKKAKRIEQFGFDYEPPTLGGFLGGLLGK